MPIGNARINTWAAIASICGVVVAFYIQYVRLPIGVWDAFGIWNAHARIFDRSGGDWVEAMRTSFHPDYPGLLPLSIARIWGTLHAEPAWVPGALAFIFSMATAATIYGTITAISDRMMACAAIVSLFSCWEFVRNSASQYADVPLAYFYASTICLILLGRSMLPLAGLFAGLAAWTKNEGLLFVATIIVGLAVTDYGSIRRFLPTAFIGIVTAMWYKWIVHVPTDLFAGTAGDPRKIPLIARVADPHRFKLIASSFLYQIVSYLFLLIAVLLVGCLIRRREDHLELVLKWRMTRQVASSAIALGLMLVGYVAIYVITPLDVKYHLETSLSRLFVHVWPAAVALTAAGLYSASERTNRSQT